MLKDIQEIEIHCELKGDDCLCGDCGNEMKSIGKKKVREEVHFVPAKLEKKVFYAHSYTCSCHDELYEPKKIMTAPVPKAPIQRSLAGSTLLAHLFHQKFVLGLPTYRQEQEWASYGLAMGRDTLSNWIIKAAHDWLTPIYQRLVDHLRDCTVIHADETHYQILKRPDGRPATSQSRIWLFRTIQEAETPIILYHSSLTRERSVAESFLDGFKGYVVCDGYSGYKNLPNITLVGCWAHLRRRLYEVPGESGKAQEGKAFCDAIFRWEREFKNLSPEDRYEKRLEHVKPIVDKFFTWIGSFHAMKGKLQSAIHYAINQKKELMTFLEDGHLAVSNNSAEAAIRPLVVGRKNFLFSTSVAGAEANALAYSLIETAKANGLNARKYLAYLFDELPNLDFLIDPTLLERFLPWAKNVQLNCQ